MSGAGAPEQNGLEIAVVGMSCRFPGAESVEELWRNLRDGVESLAVLSDEQLAAAGVPASTRRSPGYVPVVRTIPDIDKFDAAFFGVNPREADVMDPQHRLFLECCWAALEDGGYDPERYPGSVGVYAGSRMNFYLMNVFSNPALVSAVGELMTQAGNEKDYLANRVSYKLNLGGPSVVVQSACSTSLVAVHMASQALLAGECDMALAGGVSVRVPEVGYIYRPGDINSPDGRVRSFDARAQGTLFGTGLGVVVLKRLADALADGDTVHAVIKGSAVTNDGARKVGFTAPGLDGQCRVVRAALTAAEVEPGSITYIEAHGTGTPVGDPIEVAALTQAFREGTEARQLCALGSVKANIGHMGPAAGIASFLRAVLALKHRQIPPSINFEQPNPQIDFANSPFFVNTELRDWKANGTPRRAGVNAFGMGGTNAHAILEEAPELEPTSPSRPWQLLLLSARTETALARQAENLAAFLARHPETGLADAAYTLRVGRKAHEHRRAVVCRDIAHAREVLEGRNPDWSAAAFSLGRERPVAFLFPGEGAYPGMGRGLYETEPTFRAQVDACCETLRSPLGLDLRELLVAADGDAERLAEARFAQPALFVIEHALARLWMEWGIRPGAMLGHGVGEHVAACLAGSLPLDDALALVVEPIQEPILERFAEGVRELCQDLRQVLLAVGPGQTLANLVREHPDRDGHQPVLSSLRGPQEREEDLPVLLRALGQLWMHGVEPDWSGFHARERRRRIPLPTYPFERQRHWVEAVTDGAFASLSQAGAAPPVTHERPNIPTPYVPPSTEVERLLAEAWQATLGIETVGINDNFFDLGGDSILGIQLLARASEAGIRLSSAQLFEHQTIAELAKVLAAGGGEETAAPPGVTSPQRELLPAYPRLAERIERLRAGGLRPESAAWLLSWERSGPFPPLAPAPWGQGGGNASVRLDAEETRALLTEIPGLQRVRPEEALLAALARSLAPGGRVLIGVAVDGATLPVLFDLGESGDLAEELRLVKEQLRGAMANGLDPVLLGGLIGDEDLRRRLAALPSPEVRFSYLADGEEDGAALAVSARLDGEGMRLDWRSVGFGGDVAGVAAVFLAEVRALIAVCRSAAVAVYTPSDFPDAELSQEELDKLFS